MSNIMSSVKCAGITSIFIQMWGVSFFTMMKLKVLGGVTV